LRQCSTSYILTCGVLGPTQPPTLIRMGND